MSEAWTILGCGYTGERLATRLLALGHPVLATTRRPERAEALQALGVAAALEVPVVDGGVVVDSVPGGSAHLAARLTKARRIVYLSATSVYGRGDGSWVDEDTPVRPDSPSGVARVAAERAWEATGLEVVSLRIAAIHGPGRGVAERLRAGTYRVVGDGSTWSNRIHVDALVERILWVGGLASLPGRVHVVSDGVPTTSRAHADAVALSLGLPPPPSVPAEAVSAEQAAMALGNRRLRTTWPIPA
jgi:nucleoside-diphosphate-sugar epimerase